MGVPSTVIGSVGGAALDFGGFQVALDEAIDAFESVLSRILSTTMGGS
jgi:hypothetical protein